MLGNVVGARWILIEALDINFPPKSRGSSRSFDGRTAKTLVGATMPNGQKYEDWLGTRARNGRKNVENSDSS
jgi:hypothetical protein